MSSNTLRELSSTELEAVSAGLSMEDGGAASLALAATAVIAGAPFAAGFGLAVGVGLLYGAYSTNRFSHLSSS
ncbi:hypothetical protein NBRC116494_02090 [Aurantivibrio plasticivorans]